MGVGLCRQGRRRRLDVLGRRQRLDGREEPGEGGTRHLERRGGRAVLTGEGSDVVAGRCRQGRGRCGEGQRWGWRRGPIRFAFDPF